mgnify:CR=1 FL=1
MFAFFAMSMRKQGSKEGEIVARTVGGFFIGFLTTMVVVILCQSLNLMVYPLPEGLDPSNTEELAAHVANSPTGAFLGILASYFFGCFAGGAVATRISQKPAIGLSIGVALMLGGFSNLSRIDHPIWFALASTALYIPSAWLGSQAARKRLAQDAENQKT